MNKYEWGTSKYCQVTCGNFWNVQRVGRSMEENLVCNLTTCPKITKQEFFEN